MRCARAALALALVAALAAGCAAPPKKRAAPRGAQKTTQVAKKPAATPAPRPAARPAARPAPATAKAPAPAAPAGAAGGNPAQSRGLPTAAAAPSGPRAPTPREQYEAGLKALKSSQWAQAESALLAASRAYPQESGPQTNLGIVYARTKRRPQAIAALRRAVALNPRNGVAYNWLGVLLRESGDYAGAEQAYQRALAADRNDVDAQLNLAILYDQYLKRPRDALAAYQRYRTLAGDDDPRPAIWIAELQARLKPEGAAP